MSLSIIIPFKNEEKNIKSLFFNIKKKIKCKFEICFVDDLSNDSSSQIINKLKNKNKNQIKYFKNPKPGLGSAINTGILKSKFEYIVIMMCDSSDDINNLNKYYELIKKCNLDAIFGSRFYKTSKVENYPLKKLIINRIFNFIVSIMFLNKFNDYTNAFKIYKKEVLKKLLPIVSESFNVFLELPLKIISRNYRYMSIPINWYGRKKGNSKFQIKELGSKYFFTLLYCWLERLLLKF
jgi:dolichol-phosphate mannosyltransferase